MADATSTPDTVDGGAGASGRRKRVKVVLFRDARRRHRYRIVSGNGKVADAGEQSFLRRSYARKRGIAAARGLFPDRDIRVVEDVE